VIAYERLMTKHEELHRLTFHLTNICLAAKSGEDISKPQPIELYKDVYTYSDVIGLG